MDQAVIFTFLPQDRDPATGDFRASLFVAPHLTPDGPDTPAEAFPGFRDWPAVVASAPITVERRGGDIITVDPDPGPLDRKLWSTYLAPLAVRGYTYPDPGDTEIRSLSAQGIEALAQGLYTAVAAASGGDHPDPLAGGLRELGSTYRQITDHQSPQAMIDEYLGARDERRRRAELGGDAREYGTLRPPAVVPVDPATALHDPLNAALDLAEARRFYDRPEARDPDEAAYPTPDPAYVPPTVDPHKPDFHDALGALGDHPELLEALGIIIRLRLPAAFVGGGGDFRAWLDHERLEPNPVTAQPWTRAVVAGDRFHPESEAGDLGEGVLPLDDPTRFHVSQVDVDSTALLVEQRVANVYPIHAAAAGDQPVVADLPALRSTGFTVSRLRRALMLEQRLARAKINADRIAAGDDIVLFAEDLVRGFRIDVHDGGAAGWASLMHRSVRFVDRATEAEVFAVGDQEAYLKASSMTSVPNAAVKRSYLHEALFGWDGWSLVIPRPGRHIRGSGGAGTTLEEEGEQLPAGLPLSIHFGRVPGTLPVLRYGPDRTYRFRARTVDLAGFSTAFAGDIPSSPPATFRRFQPVAHAVVVPRHAFSEGESANRLVVRSGVDVGADPLDPTTPMAVVDPAAYAATLATAAPRAYAVIRDESHRHLAPPKTSQQEAELLGRFDDAIGLSPATPGAFAIYRKAFARAQREQGTLLDQEVLDAEDPDLTHPIAGIHLVPPLARDGETFVPPLDDRLAALPRGVAPAAGFVVVHEEAALAVPYLPDLLSSGVALRFVGGGTARGWLHTEVLPWDGKWPDLATYRLVLANGPAPAVTVAASVITVALPPGATAAVRSSSTITNDALDILGVWDWIKATIPADPAALDRVLDGGHQMLTPSEDLTLVHATQRPLVRPALGPAFGTVRALGETSCRFRGTLEAQSATTGRIDVHGSWSEPWDDPASGQPPGTAPGKSEHAFDLVVADGDDQVDLAAAAVKHEFRDTKHRVVTYASIATTRFREYLPVEVNGDVDSLRVGGPGATVHVLNAARPRVPVVHSVVPTFRWDDRPDDPLDPLVRSRRRRGGLRVWLERPWFPSGEGEMLGVLLSGADEPFFASDTRRQYVSLWGKDPIWRGGDLPAGNPRPRDFRGEGLLQVDRLTLDELRDTSPGVTALGHPVRYSPRRDKWFADIEADPGEAYWPFLRLGLARFQPWSVPAAHLSKAVVVDFVQLTNDRTASISRPDPDTVRVTVTGIEQRRQAPVHGLIGPPADFTLTPGRGVRAWVERRGELRTDLDWSRVTETADLVRVDEDEIMRVWQGDVVLPQSLPARRPGVDPDDGHARYRLVVMEWESRLGDEPFGVAQEMERIVYTDRFPL